MLRWLAVALACTPGVAWAEMPASLDKEAIKACSPADIEAAVECLSSSLNDADKARLIEPRSAFRPDLDRYLAATWRLDDPSTPLVKRLIATGFTQRAVGPSVVIMGLHAKLRGRAMDYPQLAAEFKRAFASKQGVLEIPVSGSASSGDSRLPEGAEEMPIAQCTPPKNLPSGSRLLGCFRLPDGQVVARIERLEAATAVAKD